MTQLNKVLNDIGELFEDIVSLTDEIADQSQAPEEETASNGISHLEEQYRKISEKIKQSLELRGRDAQSGLSSRVRLRAPSPNSDASRASVASREAEIRARLRQAELQQLERRLEEESQRERRQAEALRQQREMERSARLAEARDVAELANVEAELQKAAENDLAWNRVDDFAGETAVTEECRRISSRPGSPSVVLTGDQPSQASPNAASPIRATEAPPTINPSSPAFPEAEQMPPSAVRAPPAAEELPSRALPVEMATDMSTSVSRNTPAAAEPIRTTSTTSWINEAAINARSGGAADHTASGARRSVPQIQLPKFSGKPIEWPQWVGLFKTLIHDQQELSDAEKLAHLQSSVTGVAKQSVEGMLFDGSLYPIALKTLMEKFGREDDIVRANLAAVFDIPPIKDLDSTALGKLHAAIHCAVTVLSSLGFDADLQSTENLRRIVPKLPVTLMQAWGEKIIELDLKRPNLKDFDHWLEMKVRVLVGIPKQHSDAGKMSRRGGYRSPIIRAPSEPAAFTTAPRAGASSDQPGKEEEDGSLCTCGRRHMLAKCPHFLKNAPDERARFVGESGRCFACLKPGHRSRRCTSNGKVQRERL